MFHSQRPLSSTLAILAAVCAAVLTGCPGPIAFVPVSEHGFEAADNAQDLNDYPWTMEYFVPTGADTGHVYASTGNNIMPFLLLTLFARLGLEAPTEQEARPPEVRRYRPDLGPKVWERVFDYRDVADGPPWDTVGIRGMGIYNHPGGDAHLYAATGGSAPTVWRTAAGGPGTWEAFWDVPLAGSIRAIVEHDGLLYLSATHENPDAPLPARIYATDGEDVWIVVDDGFGNPNNLGIYTLCSWNGWLYAGTANLEDGFEVWKLAGPGKDAAPVSIFTAGGTSPAIHTALDMHVFQDRLYVGTGLLLGLNFSGSGFPVRAADLLRINPDDSWETVVGPDSIGGVSSGFGKLTNAYTWSLEEFDGYLYCGTWDGAAILPVAQAFLPDVLWTILLASLGLDAKALPEPYDVLTRNGAELYRSPDGVQWTRVFGDGLGNPNSYGVRSMVVAYDSLFVGMANVFDGLMIFRSEPAGGP